MALNNQGRGQLTRSLSTTRTPSLVPCSPSPHEPSHLHLDLYDFNTSTNTAKSRMSLFRRKKSSAKLNNHSSPQPPSTPSYPTSPPRATSLSAAPPSSWDTPQTQLHVDDFGRTIPPQPAFATNGGGVPFGQGFGIGEDEIQGEAQLLYGYTPLFTTLELSVVQVEDVVAKCAASIRKSGVFSCFPAPSSRVLTSCVCLQVSTLHSFSRAWRWTFLSKGYAR